MPSEFALIARYFTRPARNAILGVGDDCALMRARPGMELAVSTDMLVSGTHFFRDADPRKLGHKTLAVNLSDMAAMGATPRWALLSLALPSADAAWLRKFSAGLFALARRHGVSLVGGDTTRGPLNMCVTIIGEVPHGQALRRDAAKDRDDVWVSGRLGGAALAVAARAKRVRLVGNARARCFQSLEQPEPRIALGLALRTRAHAAIDISDGLIADLGHICERSGLAAEVEIDRVPRSPVLDAIRDQRLAREAMLSGGDDYELCFTAPVRSRTSIAALSTRMNLPLTRIGRMRRGRGVRLVGADGKRIALGSHGYDHFG